MTYVQRKFWLYGLDPIHVGAGKAHLSHVDMPILRDPQDGLPKVPGTSLTGVARAGAASRYWQEDKERKMCAGQGTREEPHCGDCPICHAFGTAREGAEKRGAVALSDALLVLFPLYSFTHGPLWITEHERLAAELAPWVSLPHEASLTGIYVSVEASHGIALGRRFAVPDGPLTLPPESPDCPSLLRRLLTLRRVVSVPDALFCRLVNENLEQRTSVAINPFTGASEHQALFTYEALPRASLLAGRLSMETRRWDPTRFPDGWRDACGIVGRGLGEARFGGIGGMNTRGFGRVESELKEVSL